MKVKLINAGSIYGALIGPYSGFPLGGAHFGVLAIATTSVPGTIESKDVIRSGKRRDWGDRSCDHWKLEGDLVAVPSSFASQSVVDCETGSGWIPATTPQCRIDARLQGNLWKIVGPVCCNVLQSYRQDFPDMKSGVPEYRSNIYVEIISDGNVFQRVVHYFTTNKATGKSYVTHETASYEVDFLLRRYRKVGSSVWWDFTVMAITPYKLDVSWLPRSVRDYERLYQDLRHRYDLTNLSLVTGDLVRRCANDAQVVQTNSIELVRDIRELSDTLKEAYALTKGKVSAKKIAEGYLSYKYGARLTVQDLELVARTAAEQLRLQHLAHRKVHASNVVVYNPRSGSGCGPLSMKITYTIRYRPYSQDWRRATQLVWDAGLFPSLQNSWDLVPLSFVVDWFLQLGDRLSEVDAETYWSLHDILGACDSQKMVFSDVTSLFYTPGYTLIGSCDLHYYCRSPHLSAHPPSYFVNQPREFRNYAEATALIVANFRR